MWTVYVLRSKKDGRRYIGCTNNFERRLNQHGKGMVRSTKDRRPLVEYYFEFFEDKREAYKREKYFKTASGRRFLNKL